MRKFSEWLNENWMKEAIYKSPAACVEYAKSKGEPQPELESKILESSRATLEYVQLFYPEGWAEGEPRIMRQAWSFTMYAVRILRGRWVDKALSSEGRKAEDYWNERVQSDTLTLGERNAILSYVDSFDIKDWLRGFDLIRELYEEKGRQINMRELSTKVTNRVPLLANEDLNERLDLVTEAAFKVYDKEPNRIEIVSGGSEFFVGKFGSVKKVTEDEFIERARGANSILILSLYGSCGVMDPLSGSIRGILDMTEKEYLKKVLDRVKAELVSRRKNEDI